MSSSLPDTDISMPTFLGVGCTVVSLAALAVLARLMANWRLPSRKHLDDFVPVAAVAFVATTTALYHHTLVKLSDPTVSYDYLIQLSRETIWVGSVAMWISKVPVLLLYISLFGIKKWVKYTSQGIIGLTAVIFLVMAAYCTSECSPQGEVDMTFIQQCSLASSRTGLVLGITSVVTDGITFFLPIPTILGLALPFHKKIGVCLVFATGALAIITSTISTNYKYASFKGSSSGAASSMICTIVECAIAIVVSCATAIHNLWAHTIASSTFYSKIKSSLSQKSLSLRGSSSHAGKSAWTPSFPVRGSAEEPINHQMDSIPRDESEAYRRPAPKHVPVAAVYDKGLPTSAHDMV